MLVNGHDDAVPDEALNATEVCWHAVGPASPRPHSVPTVEAPTLYGHTIDRRITGRRKRLVGQCVTTVGSVRACSATAPAPPSRGQLGGGPGTPVHEGEGDSGMGCHQIPGRWGAAARCGRPRLAVRPRGASPPASAAVPHAPRVCRPCSHAPSPPPPGATRRTRRPRSPTGVRGGTRRPGPGRATARWGPVSRRRCRGCPRGWRAAGQGHPRRPRRLRTRPGAMARLGRLAPGGALSRGVQPPCQHRRARLGSGAPGR